MVRERAMFPFRWWLVGIVVLGWCALLGADVIIRGVVLRLPLRGENAVGVFTCIAFAGIAGVSAAIMWSSRVRARCLNLGWTRDDIAYVLGGLFLLGSAVAGVMLAGMIEAGQLWPATALYDNLDVEN